MQTKKLRFVFLAAFLFAIHTALLLYINSSMLGLFVGRQTVSILFVLGSAMSLLVVTMIPKSIELLGNKYTSAGVLLISSALLWSLGHATSTYVIVPLFVAYLSLNTTVLYTFDIFIQHYSRERNTGSIRGLFLTTTSLGTACAPILVGFTVHRYGFSVIYAIAACVVFLTSMIILFSQRHFNDSAYKRPNSIVAFRHIRHMPALRRILSVYFFLQFFYAWMVIYTPVYLTKILHFSWSSVGVLFSCMLLAFVFFEYPVGKVADSVGEKKLLITGLLICAGSTLVFSGLHNPTILICGIVLFCTRIGASFIEVLCDTYFFKHVTDSESEVISLYRTMVPLAFIVAPAVATVVFFFGSYTLLYTILGLILIGVAVYTTRLVDTATDTNIVV